MHEIVVWSLYLHILTGRKGGPIKFIYNKPNPECIEKSNMMAINMVIKTLDDVILSL